MVKLVLTLVVLVATIDTGRGSKKAGEEIAAAAPTDSIPQLPGWKLVWNDEFSGTSVDLTKWEYEVNGQGGGNNELQYYTANPSNSFVQDGELTIRAQKEAYLGKQYTSARMRTRNKGDWKYGRVEVRAKVPYGRGMWPAIWMLPTDREYGGWPMSGEIDIMECLGQDPWTIYGTIHFGQSVAAHQQMGGKYIRSGESFAVDFHVYTIEWDSTSIRWSVDGAQYFTAVKSSPFDKRFHLLLNVAVGGNWPGSPDEFTTFPQTMMVDYVRVYQRP
ncbi:glycoside hydrolase family 16 protein [bacterium]|nr:MAG: glycoside hydrolase family 16 protein [bacterium]